MGVHRARMNMCEHRTPRPIELLNPYLDFLRGSFDVESQGMTKTLEVKQAMVSIARTSAIETL